MARLKIVITQFRSFSPIVTLMLWAPRFCIKALRCQPYMKNIRLSVYCVMKRTSLQGDLFHIRSAWAVCYDTATLTVSLRIDKLRDGCRMIFVDIFNDNNCMCKKITELLTYTLFQEKSCTWLSNKHTCNCNWDDTLIWNKKILEINLSPWQMQPLFRIASQQWFSATFFLPSLIASSFTSRQAM